MKKTIIAVTAFGSIFTVASKVSAENSYCYMLVGGTICYEEPNDYALAAEQEYINNLQEDHGIDPSTLELGHPPATAPENPTGGEVSGVWGTISEPTNPPKTTEAPKPTNPPKVVATNWVSDVIAIF